MANIQAAVGCAQLERVEELTSRKRQILGYYRDHLERFDGVAMNPEPAGTVHGAWMPTVVFDRELRVTREQLQSAFAAENVDARVFFYPLSKLPMFAPEMNNQNAWDIPGRAINLPSYHEMTEDDLRRVTQIVTSLI
jgi:perosamine synthetase